MKKYLTIFLVVSVLLVSGAIYAATTDFVANGDITVPSVSGTGMTANLLILSGSRTESWSYSGGVLTVTNSDNTNRFRVGVPATQDGVRSIYVNNSAGEKVDCADNTTAGTSYVEVPTAAGSYTVLPSDTACTGSSGSTSSGGGGGGTGGGTYTNPPTPPAVPAPVAPVLPPVTPNLNQLSGNVIPPSIKFFRTLVAGVANADVKSLQQFLNSNGFLVATVGPGSPGNETSMFGSLTRRAVIKFQIARGIISSEMSDGAGIVGPKTRMALNSGGGVGGGVGGGAIVQLCPNGNTIASNCSLAPNAQAVQLCPNGNTPASNCTTPPSGGVSQ